MKLYFGEAVRRLRLSQALTQEQLAKRLNVSFQTISKWERDESYPDLTMLPVLASFFGVKTDDLLGVNQAENERQVQQAIEAYERSPLGAETHLPRLQAAAERILGEMPGLRTCREHIAIMTAMPGEGQRQACEHAIAELEWMLEHARSHLARLDQEPANRF